MLHLPDLCVYITMVIYAMENVKTLDLVSLKCQLSVCCVDDSQVIRQIF